MCKRERRRRARRRRRSGPPVRKIAVRGDRLADRVRRGDVGALASACLGARHEPPLGCQQLRGRVARQLARGDQSAVAAAIDSLAGLIALAGARYRVRRKAIASEGAAPRRDR